MMARLAALLFSCACLCTTTGACAQAYGCSVTAPGAVSFGPYNPASATPLLASTTTTLTCTYISGGASTINWTMTLTNGASGNCNARTMTKPGDSLSYNIYQGSVAGGVWGNAGCATFPTGTMKVTNGSPNNVKSVTMTLYGQIPISQFVSAGSYSDTLTLTFTY